MVIFSSAADAVEAAIATDSWTNLAVVVIVLLVKFAVGSAITLPPERIMSPRELTLENRRGRTLSKSAGDGRKDVALANAPGVSIANKASTRGCSIRRERCVFTQAVHCTCRCAEVQQSRSKRFRQEAHLGIGPQVGRLIIATLKRGDAANAYPGVDTYPHDLRKPRRTQPIYRIDLQVYVKTCTNGLVSYDLCRKRC
jgi:hypothetical protein